MTIGQWFSFQGRIGRKVFWLGYIVPLLLASIVAGVLDASLGLNGYRGDVAMPDDAVQYSPISSLVSLLSIWPSLAGTIKRLHDRDRSGWWIGGFYLLSAIFGALAVTMALTDPTNIAAVGVPMMLGGIVMLAYVIWLLVETGFLRGTVGPNRFGPDPLLGGMGPQHWQQGVPPQGWGQQPPPQQWQQPGQWQQPQQPQWQPPPQGWQGGPPQGYPPPHNPGAPPPGYGQPPPQPGQWNGPGGPNGGSGPPVRRD